ncbi:hypothetical protein AH810_004763 [Salmonella enterica subsp. enterica]|nr:hypothetical protein [Salmonella enterica subsp. enterica]
MMKKTLVALALAATTVSGSAMAWQTNGTGGSLELGGTLTPEQTSNPWEVLIGSAVTNLNESIKPGVTEVSLPVTKAITVLGIRTMSNQPFSGVSGIDPQIDFNGAINVDNNAGSNSGKTPLYAKITDAGGSDIGTLSTILSVAGLVSYNNQAQTYPLQASLSNSVNSAFSGGLLNQNGVLQNTANVKTMFNSINTDFLANYNDQGATDRDYSGFASFSDTTLVFSAAYGSGILAGETIKLTLNTPTASDEIQWKASLPITVSYQ